MGDLGCVCYPNSTCNSPFECSPSVLCVQPQGVDGSPVIATGGVGGFPPATTGGALGVDGDTAVFDAGANGGTATDAPMGGGGGSTVEGDLDAPSAVGGGPGTGGTLGTGGATRLDASPPIDAGPCSEQAMLEWRFKGLRASRPTGRTSRRGLDAR
jgi:hypothetical protein